MPKYNRGDVIYVFHNGIVRRGRRVCGCAQWNTNEPVEGSRPREERRRLRLRWRGGGEMLCGRRRARRSAQPFHRPPAAPRPPPSIPSNIIHHHTIFKSRIHYCHKFNNTADLNWTTILEVFFKLSQIAIFTIRRHICILIIT